MGRFAQVLEIERELGSLPALKERFERQDWTVGELVTLTHMLRHGDVDYMELGERMLREGLSRHLDAARDFLREVA